jgi:hypothetical protein
MYSSLETESILDTSTDLGICFATDLLFFCFTVPLDLLVVDGPTKFPFSFSFALLLIVVSLTSSACLFSASIDAFLRSSASFSFCYSKINSLNLIVS